LNGFCCFRGEGQVFKSDKTFRIPGDKELPKKDNAPAIGWPGQGTVAAPHGNTRYRKRCGLGVLMLRQQYCRQNELASRNKK